MDSAVTEYIKRRLNCQKLSFGRLSFVWSDASSTSLLMARDKPNLVDGLLILNFGITTTGTGVPIIINDFVSSQEIYRNPNNIRESLMSPFVYFVKGTEFNFTTTVQCFFGFNYMTVQVDTKK